MTEIISRIGDFIESYVQDQASPVIVKNWGFVELVKRESRGTTKNKQQNTTVSTQPIPMTITGTHKREQVALDDTKDFIFWTRVTDRVRAVLNEEDSWGLKEGKRQNLPLRIVIAHKVELGENLVYHLMNDFPPNLYIDGFEFVFLNPNGDIDNDHETIHDTELGATNYEKHRFPWSIYVINLTVEFIPCTGYVVPEFLVDEFGNYLTS